MNTLQTQRDRFLRAVSNASEIWNAIDLRVIALKLNDDWQNLATRCYLSPHSPADVAQFTELPSTDTVLCRQKIYPSTDLAKLIDAIIEGVVDLDGSQIRYAELRSNGGKIEPRPYSNGLASFHVPWEYPLEQDDHWSAVPYSFWSAETLHVSGTGAGELIGRAEQFIGSVDMELRTAAHPLDGIDGAARFFLGYPGRLPRHQASTAQVIAPYHAAIDRSGTFFRGDELKISLRATSPLILSHLQIGYFAWARDGVPESASMPMSSAAWTTEGDELTNELQISLPERDAVVVFLNVGARCIHRLSVAKTPSGDSNRYLRAYGCADQDLSSFITAINPTDSGGASNFERNIPRLFHFLGFSVDVLAGERRLGEWPDGIAFHPTDATCFAIECTVGPLAASGKLSKLVTRASQLREVLDFRVCPTIVTSLSRAQIPDTDKIAAARDHVIVLAREEIDRLVDLANGSAPIDQVMGVLFAAIPEPDERGVPQ